MSHQFEETGSWVGGHLWTTAALLQNSSLTKTSRNTIEIPRKDTTHCGFWSNNNYHTNVLRSVGKSGCHRPPTADIQDFQNLIRPIWIHREDLPLKNDYNNQIRIFCIMFRFLLLSFIRKKWLIQILTLFEVTTSISLSGECITVVTGCSICHVFMISIWPPLTRRQCTALSCRAYIQYICLLV